MSIAFVDRPPTPGEFEKLRLILSTYQDGSGMLTVKGGHTLPGWRDLERTIAAALGGEAQENKAVFDVLVPDPEGHVKYGISCKMRSELNRISKDGRVTIELSNSSKKFLDHLNAKGLQKHDYKKRADQVGAGLIELVESWKLDVSTKRGGEIDLSKSCYLTLMYNKAGDYQFHWFRAALPDPSRLRWYYPEAKRGKKKVAGHLNGDDRFGGRVFEWYSDSGGQLKYYPLAKDAVWASELFRLEPISLDSAAFGLVAKAQAYFPNLWAKSADHT